MGVPAFFRWLLEKYPKCVQDVLEDLPPQVDGIEVPIDITKANPNGLEFDNLYLDMNGIIHPCVHPEDVPAPKTLEEMFCAITAYIDRLVAAVRPRKVLFMAIDGVAPRAKMNQQRSRRFKAAEEIREAEEVEEELRAALIERGQKVPPRKAATFDHNVITPGTSFMDRLSQHLLYYAHERVNNHAGWRGLKVILSDASVPGEGEHKIMEFVRQQRAQPGYSPHTRHILHGLDADLIMLGLATHEPHFTILREDVFGKGAVNKCHICGRPGHRADQCTGYVPPDPSKLLDADVSLPADKDADSLTSVRALIQRKPLQFMHVAVLREYLYLEYATHVAPTLPFPFDLERVIDDFVFMCFFVGNDFLPHLPSMDIREGAIDLLIALYKQLLPSLGGYITENGHVWLSRADVLLSAVGSVEDEIFRRRRQKEEREARRNEGGGRGGGHGGGRGGGRGGGAGGRNPRAGYTPTMNATRDVLDDALSSIAARAASETLPAGPGKAADAAAAAASAPPPAKLARRDGGEAAPPDNRSAAAKLRSSLLASSSSSGGVASAPSSGGSVAGPAAVAAEAAAAPLAGKKRSHEEAEVEDAAIVESAAAAAAAPAPAPEAGDEDASPTSPASDELEVALSDEEAAETVLPALAAVASSTEDWLDGDIAGTIKDMLKVSVSQALMAKRTREGVEDEVQLGARGWKDRYYQSKFGEAASGDPAFRRAVCRAYVEGLVWVFRYYYQGVASWKWFYPYHFAPFASDLTRLDELDIRFELGRPFSPLEQLMAVLPPRSAHALPSACSRLMTDASSPILDFYPPRFAMDPNGKKFTWQWVVLLPFIDEKRLAAALASVANTFTPEERRRNTLGNEILVLHSATPMGKVLAPLYSALGGAAASAASGGEGAEAGSSAAGSGDDDLAGLADGEGLYVENAPYELGAEGGASAAAAAAADARIQPVISPAVAEALAAAAGTGKDGSPPTPMVVLFPDTGDADGKGFSARCVSLSAGGGAARGLRAVLPGGEFPSPWAGVLPPVRNVRVAAVTFLPPRRRVHSCRLLPGAVLASPLPQPLGAEDDPHNRIPRLTRGFNIADLAYAVQVQGGLAVRAWGGRATAADIAAAPVGGMWAAGIGGVGGDGLGGNTGAMAAAAGTNLYGVGGGVAHPLLALGGGRGGGGGGAPPAAAPAGGLAPAQRALLQTLGLRAPAAAAAAAPQQAPRPPMPAAGFGGYPAPPAPHAGGHHTPYYHALAAAGGAGGAPMPPHAQAQPFRHGAAPHAAGPHGAYHAPPPPHYGFGGYPGAPPAAVPGGYGGYPPHAPHHQYPPHPQQQQRFAFGHGGAAPPPAAPGMPPFYPPGYPRPHGY